MDINDIMSKTAYDLFQCQEASRVIQRCLQECSSDLELFYNYIQEMQNQENDGK